ncbi:MAG: hypothetical protein WA621_16055 [Candidatus Acidiferrum sp.]
MAAVQPFFPRKPGVCPLYEFHGIAMGAHWAHQLLEDRYAYSCTRMIVLEKIRGVTTPHSQRLP